MLPDTIGPFPVPNAFRVPSPLAVRTDRLTHVTCDVLSAVASALRETASAARGGSLPAVREDVLHTLAEARTALELNVLDLIPSATATASTAEAVRKGRSAVSMVRHAQVFATDTFRHDRRPTFFLSRADVLDRLAADIVRARNAV